MSAYIYCPECRNESFDVDTFVCSCGHDPYKEIASLKAQLLAAQQAADDANEASQHNLQVALDACKERDEAVQRVGELEKKLDYHVTIANNTCNDMTAHLGRPFTSHATDALQILFGQIDALRQALGEVGVALKEAKQFVSNGIELGYIARPSGHPECETVDHMSKALANPLVQAAMEAPDVERG